MTLGGPTQITKTRGKEKMNVHTYHRAVFATVMTALVLAGCGTIQPYMDKAQPYLDRAKTTVRGTFDKIGLDQIEIKPTPDKLPGDDGS